MMNFLKSTDIFGPRIELRLGKKKSHKTFCGGVVTVSIVAICLAALVITGEDLFYHQNPRVTFKEVIVDYDENSDGSSTNSVALSSLGINIGLFESNGNQFDWQNGFSLNLHLVSYCQKGYRKSLEIPLRNCQNQDITGKETREYYKENQSYLQCVDSIQQYNLQGNPSDYPSSYFEISVTCKNKMLCRQYSQLFVKLFFQDNYFTPQFFNSAFTSVSRHKQVLFQITDEGDVQPEQNYDMQIQKTTVLTEQSRFFQEFSENQFFIFKSFTNSVQKDINRPAFLLRIYLSSLNTIYERRYVTFPELLAVIGGLMKALMAIGQVLVKPIAKLSLHSQLVNELFFFEENDKEKQTRHNFFNSSKQKEKSDKERDCSRQPTLRNLFSLKNGMLPALKGETKSNQDAYISNNCGGTLTAGATLHQQGLNGQFMTNPVKKSLFSQEAVLRELTKLQTMRGQSREDDNQHEEQSNSHKNQKIYEEKKLQLSAKNDEETRENKQVSLENILPTEESESAKDSGRMINDDKEDSFNKIKEEQTDNRRFSVDQQNNGQLLERILHDQSGYEDNIESDRKFTDFIDTKYTDEINEKIQDNQDKIDQELTIYQKTQNNSNDKKQLNDQFKQGTYDFNEKSNAFNGQQTEIKQPKEQQQQQVSTYLNKKTILEDDAISKERMIGAENNTMSAYQNPSRQFIQSNFSRKNSIEIHINMSERSIGNNNNNSSNQNQKVGFYPQHPAILKLKQEDLVKSNFLEGVKKFRRESGCSMEGNHHLMTKFLRRQVDIRKGKRKETSKEQVEANQVFESVLDETHKKPLEFSWRDYFSFFACKFSCLTRKKQVKYSLGKIRERFDIIYILRKLAEVDKLKVLLLTREQQRLFEFTPKPCVSADPETTETINKLEFLQNQNHIEEFQNSSNNNNSSKHNYGMMARWSLLHSEKSALDKFTDAFNAFKDIQKKRDKEPLDERLLEMLNPEILECFNAAHAVSEVTSPFQGIRQQQLKLGGSKNSSQRRISEKLIENYVGTGQYKQQMQQPVEIQPFKHRTFLIPRTNSIEISAMQQNPFFKDIDGNSLQSRLDTAEKDDADNAIGYDSNHIQKYLPYQNCANSNESNNNSENCSDCIREEQLFQHYRNKSLSASYDRDGSNLKCGGSQYIPQNPQTPVLSPKQPIYVTNYKANFRKENPSFAENCCFGNLGTDNQFSDRTNCDSCSKFQPILTKNQLKGNIQQLQSQARGQSPSECYFMSPQSKIYSQPASPTYGKNKRNQGREQHQNDTKNRKLHKYSQSIQLQCNDYKILPMHSPASSQSVLRTRETENRLGSYPSSLLKYQDSEQQIIEINNHDQRSPSFSSYHQQQSPQLTDGQFSA